MAASFGPGPASDPELASGVAGLASGTGVGPVASAGGCVASGTDELVSGSGEPSAALTARLHSAEQALLEHTRRQRLAGPDADTGGGATAATGPARPDADPDQPLDVAALQRQLAADEAGYWSIFDSAGRAGDLYRFGFADGRLRPDVASRFQPQGVHGPSECIDPRTYHWQCGSWRRPGWSACPPRCFAARR